MFEMRDMKNGTHIVSTLVIHPETSLQINIINVNALIIYGENQHFLDSLIRLKEENFHQNNIIAGDFNIVWYSHETMGGNIVRVIFKEMMEDLIMEWDMIDIVPKHGKHTWTNCWTESNHIAARLDIFLIHND